MVVSFRHLGIQSDYVGWSLPVIYETANGPVEQAAFANLLGEDYPAVTPCEYFLFAIFDNLIIEVYGILIYRQVSID